jgi:NTE family protein
MKMPIPTRKKKVALVIGSGSVKCAAALGLWKVLQHADLQFDMLVGCSGGSIYSTTMALGLSVDDCIAKTKLLWNSSVTEKRNWRALASVILPGAFKFNDRFGMIDDGPMLKNLGTAFGDKTFADTKTPLYIMTTDFYTGDSVVLNEGRVLDAIRASIAIPFIWSAWPHNGRMLIDGAASNPLPIDVAIREGADIILAMGFQSPLPSRVKSVSRYAFHINGLMTNNLYQSNFSFHNAVHHAEIIPIFPEFERPIRLFDTDQIPYVIEMGEKAMEGQLGYLQQLLSL